MDSRTYPWKEVPGSHPRFSRVWDGSGRFAFIYQQYQVDEDIPRARLVTIF